MKEERGFQLSECYTKYAEAAGDAVLCNGLPEGGEGRFSRVDCIKRVALSSGNAELCEPMAGEERTRCLRDLAMALEDAALCAKIQRVDEQARCYAELARSLQDPEICRRVSQDRERASCKLCASRRDNCRLATATRPDSPSDGDGATQGAGALRARRRWTGIHGASALLPRSGWLQSPA